MGGCKTTDTLMLNGTTGDRLLVHASSDCEIGIEAIAPYSQPICYLRPQEARELAAYLIKLADEIENENATD